MRKTFYLIIIASVFISCSKEGSTDNPLPKQELDRLVKVTPQRVRIGDTIVIEGNGLERAQLYFNGVRSHKIISAEDKKIVAEVPAVNSENVVISTSVTQTAAANSLDLSIFGLFTMKKPLDGNRPVNQVEAATEDIVYISSGQRLYKSMDGGYTWEYIKYFDFAIMSLFFINENQGWVSLGDTGFGSGRLYYTNDGGDSFQNIYTPDAFFEPGGGLIMDMYFSSENKGYLLTAKGDILVTENNSTFELLYFCPLSNRESSSAEYRFMGAFDNTIGATGGRVLIKGEGDGIDYSYIDRELGRIQFINENEAYVTKYVGGYSLHLLNLNNDTWEKLSDRAVVGFDFSNSAYGVGIFYNRNTKRHDVLESINGELIWNKNLHFRIGFYAWDMSVKGNVGYIGGSNNILVKFIRE